MLPIPPELKNPDLLFAYKIVFSFEPTIKGFLFTGSIVAFENVPGLDLRSNDCKRIHGLFPQVGSAIPVILLIQE